jgi:large subunit ribosomal protein L4
MKDIFNKRSIGLIHKVYTTQLKNKKKYTASTKTRSEVRGGGRKPWKQKGTGQARAGSTRSPIWVGGGVSFGPQPYNIFKKVNKKEKRLAILAAIALKNKDSICLPDSSLELKEPKTRCLMELIKTLKINANKRILLIVSKVTGNLKLASKNIPNVTLVTSNSLCLEDLLKSDKIILTEHTYNVLRNKHELH